MFSRLINFFKPQAFEGDAYGYLTNQISHGYLGIVLTTYLVFSIFLLTGTYPQQGPAVICIIMAYFLLWEIGVQGWRGWDSLEDTLFVSSGAAMYLFIEMDIVIFRLVGILTIMNIVVAIGTFRRTPYYKAKRNERR